MDLKKELTREGVRGGQEQFKWDSLKSMSSKQREHYLGYTTKLGYNGKMGEFQKNDWWRTKKSESSAQSNLSNEKQAAKDLEKQLMDEALGIKPQRLILAKSQLSADQVNSVLKNEDTAADNKELKREKDGYVQAELINGTDTFSMHGLGFNAYGTSNPITIFDDEDDDILHPQQSHTNLTKLEVKVERDRSRSRSRSRTHFIRR